MDKHKDAWQRFSESGKVSDYIDYRRSLLSEISADDDETENLENEDESEHRRTGD